MARKRPERTAPQSRAELLGGARHDIEHLDRLLKAIALRDREVLRAAFRLVDRLDLPEAVERVLAPPIVDAARDS